MSAGMPSSPPLPYAGWWSRVGASLLDGLIDFGFMIVPLGAIAVALYVTQDEDTADSLMDLISIPFLLIYSPHDKMANTFVVRAEFGVVAPPPPPVEWGP